MQFLNIEGQNEIEGRIGSDIQQLTKTSRVVTTIFIKYPIFDSAIKVEKDNQTPINSRAYITN